MKFVLIALAFVFASMPAQADGGASVATYYAQTNVSTAAWTVLVESTAKSVKGIAVTDTGGHDMWLGIGAAGSEAVNLIIPALSSNAFYPLPISYGKRIVLKNGQGTAIAGKNILSLIYY